MVDTGGSAREPDTPAPGTPESYYRPLVRLAALLTGDADLAETVAGAVLCEAMLNDARAPQTPLADLQREVVVRARRARRRHRGSATSDFAQLPVVRALQALPAGAREAVVLTYYLDLPRWQAAAIAGVTEAVLLERITAAMGSLAALLPAE